VVHDDSLVAIQRSYQVPIHKWLICPISASGKNLNPQNTQGIPQVFILTFLELEQIISSLEGHSMSLTPKLMTLDGRYQSSSTGVQIFKAPYLLFRFFKKKEEL